MTQDTPGYAEALAELESILQALDGDDVDIDRLSTDVGRAAELITICRDRLTATRLEVERIVADLAPDTDDRSNS
jgi:exodeoxyribonuclease VII small subunit